jgi:hypothetical protein
MTRLQYSSSIRKTSLRLTKSSTRWVRQQPSAQVPAAAQRDVIDSTNNNNGAAHDQPTRHVVLKGPRVVKKYKKNNSTSWKRQTTESTTGTTTALRVLRSDVVPSKPQQEQHQQDVRQTQLTKVAPHKLVLKKSSLVARNQTAAKKVATRSNTNASNHRANTQLYTNGRHSLNQQLFCKPVKVKEQPVCRFFQRHGQCSKRDTCTFRHVKVSKINTDTEDDA